MSVGKGYALDDMFRLDVMVIKNEMNKASTSCFAYMHESSND